MSDTKFIKERLLFTFLLCSFFNTVLLAQDNFTWDNATVYFVLTDRFNDANSSNNNSYGRTTDPVGGFLGGDLQGLTTKINDGYFDDLGVNAIWLTAPYEQIHGAVPGYWSEAGYPSDSHYAYHGYYALDFTEVDANMGTTNDMQTFVDAAHNHGIRVIMDIVLNHVGYETTVDANEFGFGPLGDPWQVPNNGLDANNSGWCNWWTDSNGNAWLRKGDTASDYCATACGGSDLELCLAGLPDIRTEMTTDVGLPKILQTKWDNNKETQEINELNTFFNGNNLPRTPANHIVKWLTDWVRDYGIDGFRIDTYKHVETSVWGTLKDEAQVAFNDWKAANPTKKLNDDDFWMVGELFGAGPGKNTDAINNGKTDALINFDFQGVPNNMSSLDNVYANYASIAADPEWNFLSYVSSHDKDLFPRAGLQDAGTALLMAPGGVQIFYGDETRRPRGTSNSDQDSRSFMNWNSIDQGLLTHWQKLGQFRNNHNSIGGGDHQKLADNPYTFHRSLFAADQQDQAVVVIGASGSTTVNVGSVFPDGTELRDFYTGTVASVSGGNVIFTAHTNGVILIEETNPVIRPTFVVSQEGGYSPTAIDVTITANDANDPNPTIYYTFDENLSATNLAAWTVYSGAINIAMTSTLRVIVENSDNVLSQEGSYDFYIGALPTFKVYLKTDYINPHVH
ncbi:MAG: alpha-amylase family glycosyl hydrolase, partial [Saprospiraceae bacterium]